MGHDLKRAIQGILRKKIVQNLGKYFLRLLSHFFRNKRSDFNYLKEIVQKVMAGWKSNLFSSGEIKKFLLRLFLKLFPPRLCLVFGYLILSAMI